MSRYANLGQFLKAQKGERVPMTFADIERITNAKLPPSAHKHRPWWSNNPTNSVMTRVWLEAGFKSEQVDMAGQRLVFRRVSPSAPASPPPSSPSGSGSREDGAPFHPLYGALRGMIRVAPGVDLSEPADPTWGGAD
jgi:hypothetical protein